MTNWESVAQHQHQHQRRHEQFISNGFFYSIRIVFNFSYLLFWKKRRERLKRWRRCNQRHGVLFIWRNSAVDEDETVLFRQKNIFVKIHKAVAICLMWSLVVIYFVLSSLGYCVCTLLWWKDHEDEKYFISCSYMYIVQVSCKDGRRFLLTRFVLWKDRQRLRCSTVMKLNRFSHIHTHTWLNRMYCDPQC